MSEKQLSGLARKLVLDGLLDQAAAEKAVKAAKEEHLPLISYVVQHGLVSARPIAQSNSELFGIPFMDIDALDFENVPKELASTKNIRKLIRKYRCFPLFKRGNRLFVGVSDPTNEKVFEELRFNSNLNIEPIIVEEDKLTTAIEKLLESATDALTGMDDDDLEDLEELGEEEDFEEDDVGAKEEDAPIIKFVNKVLFSAIKQGASDLHFEPYEKILPDSLFG